MAALALLGGAVLVFGIAYFCDAWKALADLDDQHE